MQEGIKIRRIRKSDWQSILSLWQNTPGMGLNSIDDSEEGIKRFLKRNPHTCFLAEKENETIGTIIAGHDGRRGYIYHTAVNPAERNKGVATRLVSACVEALKNEGIAKAALVVFKDNELGNGFWERMGFTERDDLNYRNKVITDREMIRNRSGEKKDPVKKKFNLILL